MSTLTPSDTVPLRTRLTEHPRPALVWTGVAVVLFALEAGALGHFLLTLVLDFLEAAGIGVPGLLQSLEAAVEAVPTLLSRETIPNEGYWNGNRFVGTFMGLSPFHAWALRATLVYVYAFAVAGWAWVGFNWYREHYRRVDRTPRDDVIDRFSTHSWGKFGLVVVFMFIVMAVFAPALGPTTVDQNLANPYSYQINYFSAGTGTVEQVTVGQANSGSRSVGPNSNVGPMSYDDYGRFHPFGTLPTGKDLFTFIAAGSRISLIIGLLSVLLSGFVATTLALVSAYYKGRIDLTVVLLSDAVMGMPQLLLLIMLTVVFADTFVGNLYNGAFILGLIFAGTGWPYLWRSLRGPALQVAEREWVDAAKGFGQRPSRIMRKHIFPYIVGYLLIYGSMTLGGAIIAIAGLTFLGLGVNPPTPEWGRAVNVGRDYIGTRSWHISFIPGALITLVVTGFNALGDGIRDAIDPQSEGDAGNQAGRGGGA